MVTTQEFVSSQLKLLHRIQNILCLAYTAAASHKLKLDLQNQMTELDQLESQYQTLSAQRGWDFSEIQEVRWLTTFRLHNRKDSTIAEYFIRLYTQDSIFLLKLYNRWEPDDQTVRNLFQKFIDRCTIGIRQMQHYL